MSKISVLPNLMLKRLTSLITWQATLIRHLQLKKIGKFLPNYMTNVMTSISTLSIFHYYQVIYHLALLIVFTSRSSLDMQDAAHTMMISDIAIKCELKGLCLRDIDMNI